MQPRLVLALAVCLGATAHADIRQRPVFTQTTTFQSCHTSIAFACGMRDPQGRTYGTAHPIQICERYVFRPDGTFTSRGGSLIDREGTYRIFAGTVRMTTDPEPDEPSRSFELKLSADGGVLGEMKRLPR